MQHTVTTLCAKPHVAQFIRARYKQGDVVKLPRNPIQLYTAVKACTTPNFHKRMLILPEGLEQFKAILPGGYHSHYLAQSEAGLFAEAMEKYFWEEFKNFIHNSRNEVNKYKDHAIREFQEMYGVSESLYPIDHFRRKLNRSKVKGLRPELPKIRERLHPRIPDQVCWQMYRVHKDRKVSIRRLTIYYHIHHDAIRRIFQKIKSRQLSKSASKSASL